MLNRLMAGQSDREWVSKTEFARYLRCPYVFWLVDTGQIAATDAWTSIQARLIAEGQRFHTDVIRALPTAKGIRSLQDVIAQDVRVLGLRDIYRNDRLKILGTPDGVDAAGGALFPIEIKSHREVSTSDKLELAFYYLLLEPYRTIAVEVPKGHVWLRREDGEEYEEIVLEPRHFDRVVETLDALRIARRDGVQPRVHSCAVCSGLLADQVLESVHRRKDVSLIFGVGPQYATELNRIGIRTYEDLVGADPEAVAWAIKKRIRLTETGAVVEQPQPYILSPGEVERWIAHAMSYIHRRPTVCGRGQLPPLEKFLVLDLEWDDVTGSVWLVGACIVAGSRRKYLFLWEDTPREERTRIVKQIVNAAASNVPVITWSGASAEFTRERSSIRGLDLPSLLATLRPHHLDAYQFMARNVRLPSPHMTLKAVARHFRIRRKSPIADGLEANEVYRRFRKASGARRERLRRDLRRYNQDDLDCTAKVVQRLHGILAQYDPTFPDRLH